MSNTLAISSENESNRINYTVVWNSLFFVSAIVTIFTLFFNKSVNLVGNIALLPLAHCIYLCFARKLYRKQLGLSVLIVQIVMICRFIVIPLMFALNGTYTGVLVDSSKMELAVWYMFYEEVAVGVTAHLWASIKHKDNPIQMTVYEEKKYIRPLTMAIILFWFYIIIVNSKLRGYLLNFGLITRAEMGFTQYISLAEYQTDIPGIFKIFFYIGLIVVFVTAVHFISVIKAYKGIKVAALATICICFISSMWSSGFTVSRWGMLIATILSVYVMMYSFPNRKKAILKIGITVVVLVVVVGSVLKIASFGVTDASVTDAVEKYFNTQYFDEYFEGVGPVANGLTTAERYAADRGVEGVFLDWFYNFPYAMKILNINSGRVATDYFHQVTGHYDLIMPTVTQSIMQFGGMFAPLYSCIMLWFALWFDRKQQAAKTLYKKLFYTVLVFWMSLFMAVNTNVIESHIWFAVIGLVLITIEERVCISVRK